MEAKKKLAAWLHSNKRNYHEGVSIMKALGISVDNPKFFDVEKATKIHESILLRQLSEYARVNQVKPEPMQVVSEKVVKPQSTKTTIPIIVQSGKIERPKVDKNPVVRYEDLPVNLQVLFDENGKLQGEIKTLHEKLKLLKNKADAKDQRAKLARDIIQRQRKNRANWNEIDTWWAEQKVEQNQDPIELAKQEALEKDKRIKANLNYIRRFHGREEKKAEVALRMKELDKWGVSYAKLIG